MQNSIISYDKYIFIYTFVYKSSTQGSADYYSFNGIYYMNVETEEWTLGTQVGTTAEPSKIKLISH